MIRAVIIEGNRIPVIDFEVSLTKVGKSKRNVSVFLVNKEIILNKNRHDKIEFICEICGKVETKGYYTVESFKKICARCKNSSFIKSQNIVDKSKIITITQKDEVNFCSILFKKREALVVNNLIYITRGMKLKQTCLNCNKEYTIKFTSISEYHRECPNCTRELTSLEKYGVRNNFQSPKTKKTLLEKYGVDSINKVEEIKEKKKEVMKEKYGEENPWKFGSDNFKESMMREYGVDNALKNDNVKEIISNKVSQYRTSLEFRSKLGEYILNKFQKSELVEPLFKKEDYINNRTPTLWKCKKCNNNFKTIIQWNITPRCPICFPKIPSSSNMERELANWIKSLGIGILENNRSVIDPLELDIYIPSHNLAIEFDGLYWHSELQGKDKDYHIDKTNRCLEKGIHLLHIWENEWIEKQDIVKSIIKNNLGLHDKVVYGRNCIVKDISSKEANEFYDKNHIQSSHISSINLGLYFQDELVSCLTFSKSRYNKKYDWEIIRFANKLNYKVHGSFGKLWKHKPVGSIITYSDKRLFSGTVYKKYMKQLPDSKPSYWYWKNDFILHSRLEFQKHKLQKKLELYDDSLNEWENMQLNGYDRIWDCGNWVFESK